VRYKVSPAKPEMMKIAKKKRNIHPIPLDDQELPERLGIKAGIGTL
jgi:hypothetical protein